MKLLIATDNYAPRYDGISRFLQETIPALAEHHDVHVLAPNYGPTQDSVPTTKIPLQRIQIGDYHPPKFKPFTVWKQVKNADAVFIQSLGTIGALALISARIQKKKTVLFTHSIEWELVPKSARAQLIHRTFPRVIKAIDRVLYKWIDLLITPSENVSEQYYWNRIENDRVTIHLGVDKNHFQPPINKQQAKKQAGLDPDSYIIGYHGRLAREKDLKTLLRAYKRFTRTNPQTKSHLLIVGDGLREIREMLEREGVTVTGFVANPAPLLQAMDVYVMPSTTETTCLSVLEAMSSALPVISTPVGFVNDYIQHEKNGYLFEERNDYELAKRLEELQDHQKRVTIGKTARRNITKRFSWQHTREEIVRVFNQL